MDLEPLILFIRMFERELNKILADNNHSKIELQLNVGYYRCMARIKSSKHQRKDINRRCSKHIWKDGVCGVHYGNEQMGRVNCHPIKNIKACKNHINLLDLNHTPFCSLNLKKKNTDIIKMSSIQFDYSILEDAKGSPKEIYNEYMRCNKTHRSITIGEEEEIVSEIEKRIKLSKKKKKIINRKKDNYKSWLKAFKKYSNTIHTSNLNSIKIIDKNFNDCELFEVIFKNKITLINNKKQIIGESNNWIDETDEIPREYKTADNKVLHPQSCLPILEIIINEIESIYCDILPGTYREYIYDDELESFKKTNSIIRVSH